MHQLATKVAREAVARGARLDPIDHFDDLAALDAAARRSEESSPARLADLLDRPVIVGDPDAPSGRPAVLYPLSFGAARWLEDSAALWFDNDRTLSTLCVAWAMAHARDPRAFREAGAERRRARTAILAWARDLNCGMDALNATVEGILQASTSPKPPHSQTSSSPAPDARPWREFTGLARLCREFGRDEDFFIFGPMSRLDSCLEVLRRLDDMEDDRLARAIGRKAPPRADDEAARAFVEWRRAADAFLAKFGSAS